ncbi:DNA-methyltransferase [Alienimonas chondri]|uniref:Methyltransferase n=1 Tax=Alienimonas chondri TaxID=2681879 RepID=A0ABX1VCB7_9PLAN|nr:DNA methyltransferase [Alienimonas chondri]NNJ25354.1 DNA adenine methyltransferase YhdJ [Alienimonas chondri]
MPRRSESSPSAPAAPRPGRATNGSARPKKTNGVVPGKTVRKRKSAPRSKIEQGDCLTHLQALPDECVDLVFADPPFNVGFSYDIYRDRKSAEEYEDWCRQWIEQIHRVLKPNGTFWLSIGDEFAAELKVLSTREIGFHCRSWVVWYYTFGVNCTRKFTRSHAHLFHLTKDAKEFTFNAEDPEVRVPSARQLVYNDPRANPTGRLPDDTWKYGPFDPVETDPAAAEEGAQWIIRPQDMPEGFVSGENTWYFPRVAGTFKEREGFHGCQMPEQLLGRIVRVSSNEGDLVLDPFAGTGTTPAVAKKLGRKWLGYELSEDYADRAAARLKAINVGDPLNGSDAPTVSAPSTRNGRKRKAGLPKTRPG